VTFIWPTAFWLMLVLPLLAFFYWRNAGRRSKMLALYPTLLRASQPKGWWGKARRHGPPEVSAPHILSVGFPKAPAEPLLHAMEARGVCVSAGSACHAKDKKPSATLRAIGVPDDTGVIRLSLSRFTTDDEIARAAAAVVACVKKL